MPISKKGLRSLGNNVTNRLQSLLEIMEISQQAKTQTAFGPKKDYKPFAILYFYIYIFQSSTFVGSAWSFVFSSSPQRPMTSDFEGFSIPDFIHYIYFPILILNPLLKVTEIHKRQRMKLIPTAKSLFSFAITANWILTLLLSRHHRLHYLPGHSL